MFWEILWIVSPKNAPTRLVSFGNWDSALDPGHCITVRSAHTHAPLMANNWFIIQIDWFYNCSDDIWRLSWCGRRSTKRSYWQTLHICSNIWMKTWSEGWCRLMWDLSDSSTRTRCLRTDVWHNSRKFLISIVILLRECGGLAFVCFCFADQWSPWTEQEYAARSFVSMTLRLYDCPVVKVFKFIPQISRRNFGRESLENIWLPWPKCRYGTRNYPMQNRWDAVGTKAGPNFGFSRIGSK